MPVTGGIDSVNHVGLAVRDLDAASALYERMGFTLSPLSVHAGSSKPGEPVQPMATGNRCAIFPKNYVEILGLVNPGKMDWGWDKFIARFEGSHIICFGCGDAAVANTQATSNGINTSGVITLQRDIELPDGPKTARFDCVHFRDTAFPEGLIQAAHHRNPEYVHQPRYLKHRNGAQALSEVTLCLADPAAAAQLYQKLTGCQARRDGASWVIDLPVVTRLRFLDALNLPAQFPGTLSSPPPSIVAMEFAVSDVASAAKLLEAAKFPLVRHASKVIVPAEHALGTIHVFAAA
jgi:hypothetical protein